MFISYTETILSIVHIYCSMSCYSKTFIQGPRNSNSRRTNPVFKYFQNLKFTEQTPGLSMMRRNPVHSTDLGLEPINTQQTS